MAKLDENHPFKPLRIAVLTISDTREPATDKSGDTLVSMIAKAGLSPEYLLIHSASDGDFDSSYYASDQLSIPAVAVGAYLVTGLALAPIFPTGIVWLARLRPGDSRATSWLFPAASIGGVLGPGVIGIVIAEFGVRWAPVVLAAVAVLMTAAFLGARRSAA